MTLWKLEIVRNHPIGNALGFFRNVSNSMCEKLGLTLSTDALNVTSDHDN